MTTTDPPQTFFATTRWTLIGEAVTGGEEASRGALATVFTTYWMPLYKYARRRGRKPEDAEDIVQGFFAHLLAGNGLRLADRDRGRFRAFLLGSLKHYMTNVWHRDHSQKRGGHASHLSFEWMIAETGLQPSDSRTPDQLFDREWAVALLDKVLDDLAREEPEFERWMPFISLSASRLSYEEIGNKFGMTSGAARVAVHRLRKRYRRRVREEIARTLTDESMVDAEMQALFSALAENCT